MKSNKKKLKRGDCVVCEGYGECTELIWKEPGFREFMCPCCKGTGKATKKRVKEFDRECREADAAEAKYLDELYKMETRDHQ